WQRAIEAGTPPSVDEAYGRLYRACWLIGDALVDGRDGPYWLVTGRNGKSRIRVKAATKAEAWHLACQEAEALGMIAPKDGSLEVPS
ncbi:hypothetical protein ACYOEI_41680, partial [Singulisphaera rosea]